MNDPKPQPQTKITMKNLFTSAIIGAATLFTTVTSIAQTNELPVIQSTGQPQVYAGSLGQQTVLSSVPVAPFSTNLFVVGYNGSTNPISAAQNNNQVFIGTSDIDYLGIELSSVVPTNSASTNLSGNVTLFYRASRSGVLADTTTAPTAVVLNSTGNTYSGTNAVTPASVGAVIDARGLAGIFITQIGETNAGVNSATNYVTVRVLAKAAKVEAIPSSFNN